jgi:hypothetical protein
MKQDNSRWGQVLACLSLFTVLLFIGELVLTTGTLWYGINLAAMAIVLSFAIGYTIVECKENQQ